MLRFATIAGTAVLLTLPIAAQQQDNSAQQQQPSQSGNQNQQSQSQQKKPEKKKSSAEANPFPEAQSEKAAQQQNPQQDSSVPSAPGPSAQKDQAAPAKKPSAADANPFPEAKSEKAQQQEEQSDQPNQADDQNYSSSQVHVSGMDMPESDEDTAPIQASSPLPYDPKLAKKDAQIGDFYLETGDFKGAYDRFVEAARSDPGNAEAVWGLAESARRLQMNEVAIKNYRLYLAALPNGPHAKEIRKALKDMGIEPGS